MPQLPYLGEFYQGVVGYSIKLYWTHVSNLNCSEKINLLFYA